MNIKYFDHAATTSVNEDVLKGIIIGVILLFIFTLLFV